MVTGVYEPVPLGEVDRPVTQLPVASDDLVANSLEDFLRLDPSVDLQERGVNGTQADVAMRGGTFEQTLILVDGFRMNDLQTGHHDMDLPFPVDSFSDVEILHGAGSALYGSDAVGGAINFITHPPPVTELRVRGGIGNFGVNQESGTGSVVDGRLAEQLIFARDYSSGFITDRDYRDLALTSLTDFSTGLGNSELIVAHNDRPFGANQFYGPVRLLGAHQHLFCGRQAGSGKIHPVFLRLSPSPRPLRAFPRRPPLLSEPACAAELPGGAAQAAGNQPQHAFLLWGGRLQR